MSLKILIWPCTSMETGERDLSFTGKETGRIIVVYDERKDSKNRG